MKMVSFGLSIKAYKVETTKSHYLEDKKESP